MALVRCPDCSTDISTEAVTCPKCGRPNIVPKTAQSYGCGTLLLLSAAIVVLVAIFSANSGSPSSSAASGGHHNGPAATPADLNDAKALDSAYDIAANVHCASDADDYLRKLAKYDFKWDDTGFLESKFDKYQVKTPAPGILVVVSDKAKLQNGFGAFRRLKLLCFYDTQAQTVQKIISLPLD